MEEGGEGVDSRRFVPSKRTGADIRGLGEAGQLLSTLSSEQHQHRMDFSHTTVLTDVMTSCA